MTQKQPTEETPEEAENAILVYDKEYVHELFGFAHPGSTRKLMSRYGVNAVVGYAVDDIEYILDNWDPDKAWPRPHPKPEHPTPVRKRGKRA